MADKNAAPAWPDDAAVYDALNTTTEDTPEGLQYVLIRGLSAMGFAQPSLGSWELMRAALAAIAPHVAAEREAAWIAGRDKAVARMADIETFHINPLGGANIVVEGGDRFVHERDLRSAIKDAAALTPPSTSALDAQVAARVAEAVAKAVPPGHVVVPRMDEGERNRVIGLAEICEADSTRSHFGADLADDIAQTLRKLADALYPAAKEPGHES